MPPGASDTPSALGTRGRGWGGKTVQVAQRQSPTAAGCLIGKARSETVTNLMSKVKFLAFCAVLCT